jgi:hypothetical protein
MRAATTPPTAPPMMAPRGVGLSLLPWLLSALGWLHVVEPSAEVIELETSEETPFESVTKTSRERSAEVQVHSDERGEDSRVNF